VCWTEQDWPSLDEEKRKQLKSFFDRCYTLAPSENPRKVASTVLLEVFLEGSATNDLFKNRRTAIMEVLFGSVLAPKPKNKKAGGGAAGGGAGGGAASKP